MINYCQFEQADAFLVSLKFNLYICSAATWEKRKKEAHFAGEKPEDDERDKIMMGIKCKLERAADTNGCVFWEFCLGCALEADATTAMCKNMTEPCFSLSSQDTIQQ